MESTWEATPTWPFVECGNYSDFNKKNQNKINDAYIEHYLQFLIVNKNNTLPKIKRQITYDPFSDDEDIIDDDDEPFFNELLNGKATSTGDLPHISEYRSLKKAQAIQPSNCFCVKCIIFHKIMKKEYQMIHKSYADDKQSNPSLDDDNEFVMI